jgi:hypothetical protein
MQRTPTVPRPTEGAAFRAYLRRKARIYAAIGGIRIKRPRPAFVAIEVRR